MRSFPRLSLLDNVVAGAYGAGLRDDEAIATAHEALARVGLQHLAAQPAGELTNKNLRLMELARAWGRAPLGRGWRTSISSARLRRCDCGDTPQQDDGLLFRFA